MRKAILLAAGTVLVLTVATPANAGGGRCVEPRTSASTDTVVMSRNCFAPLVTHVTPGTSVSFVNDDSYPHTVTGAAFEWGSDANLGGGATITARFDEPGVYPYVCLLHPGMLGAVVVDGGVAPAAEPVPQDEEQLLAAATPPAPVSLDDPRGVAWPFALGLATLTAVVGLAAGWLPSRRRATE